MMFKNIGLSSKSSGGKYLLLDFLFKQQIEPNDIHEEVGVTSRPG